MDLSLKYPPTPRYASELAALAASAAGKISGVKLDYSPGSLASLEVVLDGFSTEGLVTEAVASTLFCFGCYVGEVLIRNVGGSWMETRDSPMKDYCRWPLVLSMESGDWWNPIGKVFKRFEEGETESLTYFYSVASSKQLTIGS